MPLLTATYEDALETLIETVGVPVFVTEVPANEPSPSLPYIVLYFGGPVRTAFDHHMAGHKNDTMVAFATVQVVSKTDKSARDVADAARRTLLGYTPPNCGEVSIEGALSYSNARDNVPPTKFVREIGITFPTNQESDN